MEVIKMAKNYCCQAEMHHDMTGQWSSVFGECKCENKNVVQPTEDAAFKMASMLMRQLSK